MTHEQYLALEMIARLANRFGPASRIAKELPGWLEYLTEVECPERPRTRPSSQWWNKIRTIAHDLVPTAGGGEGEIVVLRGIPTVIDDERIQGFTEVIDQSNIKILDIQYANWNQDEAFTLMQDYLSKYPNIDAVWANDDDMLLGVLEAVDQAGREDVRFALGGNGMKQVIEMVKAGDARTPISTPYPPSMIASAIYMTAAQFTGQAPMRGSFKLDAPLITPGNADQFYFPDSPF